MCMLDDGVGHEADQSRVALSQKRPTSFAQLIGSTNHNVQLAGAVVDAERKLENKDGEVEALKMRIAALLEESTMQGRKRLVAETKNKTMSKQLDALKDEASSLISNERSLTEHLAEREHELRTRINDLSERLREEKTNRLRGLKMHLDERRAANAIAIAWQAKSEEETKVIELNAAVSAVDIDQMRVRARVCLFYLQKVLMIKTQAIACLPCRTKDRLPPGWAGGRDGPN